MPVLRRPCAFPMCFVASAHRYHRPSLFFVTPETLLEGRIVTGLDIYGHSPDGHPYQFLSDGAGRASQVPGESSRASALLLDPGRALLPCHLGSSVLPPLDRRRRPQRSQFRGSFTQLQHLLSTLPDSAFPTLARLASGGWQTLTGWDSNPLDSIGEFQVGFASLSIPTPQASPGATAFCPLISDSYFRICRVAAYPSIRGI